MTEAEFWHALRTRINQSDQLATVGYCDWFEPKRYLFGPPNSRVEGLVGFLGGSHPIQYKFTFALPQSVGSVDEMDWRRLLPKPERHGWVWMEEHVVAIDTLDAN